MRLLIAITAFAGVLLATPAHAELPALANTYCPVTTDEQVDVRYHADHEGRTVFFCCDKCRRKFLADPLRYAEALVQTPAAGAADQHPSASTRRSVKDWREKLGRLHPLVVHFPVALIMVAGLAELCAVLRQQTNWHGYARFSITVGALGALVAAPLGWLAAGPPGADALTEWHRWLGIATYLASTSAALLVRTSWLTAYRVTLLASVALVAAAGHLGGLLAYGEDALRIWN